MLVFMLAVMLPAAALIVASVFYLRHIQRGKMIEAAIQRDYQQALKIAEKRIVERAYETAEKASDEIPRCRPFRRTRYFPDDPSGDRPRISLDWERRS